MTAVGDHDFEFGARHQLVDSGSSALVDIGVQRLDDGRDDLNQLDLFGRWIQGCGRGRAAGARTNHKDMVWRIVHQRPDGAEEGVKCAEGQAGSATGLGCRG